MASPTEKKVLKQVEFYFSDSNLPRDKFLKGLTEQDDGWVSIETIASFKRMKQITTDLTVVVAALRKSESLLEVNEDGTKVKRKTAVDVNEEAIQARTVYAKGFPSTMTQESLEEWWATHGATNALRMRRLKDRTFKGSVFVEFASQDDAQKIVAAKISVPEGKEGEFLLFESRNDYIARKAAERAAKKGTPAAQKGTPAAQKGTPAAPVAEKKAEEPDREYVKDLIMHFTGLGEDATREDLKELIDANGGDASWVDYSKGQAEGFLRLGEEKKTATELVQVLNDANTEIHGQVCTFRVLQGEEEKKYWTNLWAGQAERKNKNKRKGGGRGGGKGKGGKGRNKRARKD